MIIIIIMIIIQLQTQVLAAGLENPSEGGEGIQYRCCIHTRDWKVGKISDLSFFFMIFYHF